MKRSTALSLGFGLLTIIACFLPWASGYSQNEQHVLTGIDAGKYNMAGLLHIVLASIYMLFVLAARPWVPFANLLVVAINAAWLIRNFLLIPSCPNGDCLVRQYGLYLLLIGCVGMMATTLFSKR